MKKINILMLLCSLAKLLRSPEKPFLCSEDICLLSSKMTVSLRNLYFSVFVWTQSFLVEHNTFAREDKSIEI